LTISNAAERATVSADGASKSCLNILDDVWPGGRIEALLMAFLEKDLCLRISLTLGPSVIGNLN